MDGPSKLDFYREEQNQPVDTQSKQEIKGFSGGQESLEPWGKDRRSQLEDIQKDPYRSICRVKIYDSKRNEYSSGTGLLIGKRTVLTCAHNCYDNDSGRQYQVSISFLKKENDGQHGQLIPCKSYYPNEYKIYKTDDKNYKYDYAILHLEKDVEFDFDPIPVDFTGKCIQNMKEKRCFIAGFPAQIVPSSEKVLYQKKDQGNNRVYYFLSNGKDNKPPKMYEHQAPFSVYKSLISHQVDTSPGNSGSPILINTQQDVVCIGVHIQGYTNLKKVIQKKILEKQENEDKNGSKEIAEKVKKITPRDLMNYGVALTEHNYQNIRKWYEESQKKTLEKGPKFD